MFRLTRTCRDLHRTEHGASLVEFAVILPAMVSLAFAGIEGGNFLYHKHMIVNGVRDAARYASGRLYDADSAEVTDATILAAQNIATTGTDTGGTNRVSWWVPADVSVVFGSVTNEVTCGAGGNALCYRFDGDVPIVTVSTTVAYQSLGFLAFLESDSLTISFTHQERVIGVR
jgi:Flp pilus assembly protein TadG